MKDHLTKKILEKFYKRFPEFLGNCEAVNLGDGRRAIVYRDDFDRVWTELILVTHMEASVGAVKEIVSRLRELNCGDAANVIEKEFLSK